MSMNRRNFLASAAAAAVSRGASGAAPKNIVFLYADDLGYGDTSCYGATAVRTPTVDRLAQNGVRFTDAHTSAATCTPSRYSLLTGEYSFRMPDAKVLPGDAPMLIRPGRVTLPSMLRDRGYRTAVVGKWHLGLGSGNVDWNVDISPGPLDIGFDESFILPATGDRVPCVYVENRRVYKLDPKDPITVSYKGPLDDAPTGKSNPELLKLKPSHGHDMTIVNGISRIGYMKGGKSALWKDEDMADVLVQRGVSFIEKNRQKSFFLYFATHDIHVPRAPHDRFGNSTPMGRRGNVIAEMDWSFGQIVKTLEKHNLLKDTLIIVSSDNGAVVDDGYQDEAVARLSGHKPNGPLRGGKYSNYEAGTRVPFIVHWPAQVKPGVSDALISQVDLTRSLAMLTGTDVSAISKDSENITPALLGQSKQGRQNLVEQASRLALRDGKWKFIPPGPGPAKNADVNIELGNSPKPQLYDLAADIGETRNLASAQPDRVKQMSQTLQSIRERAS